MLRLSKLTDYSTVIMTYLARDPHRIYAARDIATNTKIALPTVSKILKKLAQRGLLISERGAQGGYKLASEPSRMTLATVICAMENDTILAITECSGHMSGCQLEPHCTVRGNWRLINIAIRSALENISLADLAAPTPHLRNKLHQRKTHPIIKDTN